MNKDSVIKARCSSEIKQQVQNYTQSHNINQNFFLVLFKQFYNVISLTIMMKNYNSFTSINIISYGTNYLI